MLYYKYYKCIILKITIFEDKFYEENNKALFIY